MHSREGSHYEGKIAFAAWEIDWTNSWDILIYAGSHASENAGLDFAVVVQVSMTRPT